MAIELDGQGFEQTSDQNFDTEPAPTLVAQADTTEPAAPVSVTIEITDGSILRLPEGASIDAPRVNGANLEFVQPDGTVIVVPDGAVTGLTIFIGDVEIPPIAVAALFEENGIEAAAGPEGGEGSDSSGGNFLIPPGGIGPALPYGPLLPPTALAFGVPEDQPRYEALLDGEPTITSVTSVEGDEEGLGGNIDDGYPGDLPGSATSITGQFVFDFGTDGPNSSAAVILSATNATWTQTTNTTGTLAANDGTWQIQVFADGSYVFTILDASNHPVPNEEDDLVVDVTLTIVDGNGDSVSAGFTATIDDDAPTFTLSAVDVTGLSLTTQDAETDGDPTNEDTASASFAAAFLAAVTPVYGADGPGSTVVSGYTLGLSVAEGTDSTLTSDGAVVRIFDVGGVIYGSTAAAGADDATIIADAVFSLSVDGTGTVTLTQFEELDHLPEDLDTSNDNANIGLPTGLVTLNATATITDGDNDQVTTPVSTDLGNVVSFDDDLPLTIYPDNAVVTNGAGDPFGFELDQDGTIANNYGADGPGTVRFPASLDGSASGLTSAGVPITYDVSPDGLTLTGFAGASAIFVITLDPVSATYSVDMNGSVDSTTNVDFSSGQYAFVGGNNEWAGFIGVGETVAAPIDNNSSDLLLTPEINGVHDGSINTTANAGGVSGGASVGDDETFRVDFVTDLRGNPASTGGGDYDTLSKRDHVFDGHYTVNGSTATFTSTGGSTVNIAAFDDADTDGAPGARTVVGDGVIDPIIGVVISYNGVTQFIDLNQPLQPSYNIGGQVFTITENGDGSIDVGGVFASNPNNTSTRIGVFTSDGYNSVEYSYVSGDTFQIGDFGAAVPTTAPVNFQVPIQVVDGDNDAVVSHIDITLTAPGEGIQNFAASGSGVSPTSNASNPHIIGSDLVDNLTGDGARNVLYGNDGGDFLTGLGGDDILIGGTGSDTMTGGTGSDRLVVGADSLDGSIDDFITDFQSGGAGDILDLSEVLSGLFGVSDLEAGGYVQVTQSGANAIVSVDVDGGGNDYQQVAVLQNHTFANETIRVLFDDGTGSSSEDII